MKSIYYWSPCLDKVGTVNSTINSAISLSKYYKSDFKVYLINSCGEWDDYEEIFSSNGVNIINFKLKYYKYLPKKGYFSSRFSYIIIFLLSLFPLLKILKKNKPDFIIVHLITSLPLFLLNFFKFETEFILRISGYPRLNIFRKFFWKSISKKIYRITFPTNDLISQFKLLNIFEEKKLYFLPDAILNIKNFLKNKKSDEIQNNKFSDKKYFIAVGRLTKQKNFTYLINEFSEFLNHNKEFNLLIFGEGEERKVLNNLIKSKNLSNNVFLMGHSNNIYYHMKKASAFILSSLWEEPGFVIIEAAICNLFIISSDCNNGPKEFLNNGLGGILFNSNEKKALSNKLLEFSKNQNGFFKEKVFAKKNSHKYTMFRHSLSLKKIL